MTPLGCPDCLLIRYEPRALRARLRVNANARAYAIPALAFPDRACVAGFFFPFLFVEGVFFGLFACARFCLFFFCGGYAMSVSPLDSQPSEVIARIRGFAGRASNRGYEILDAITISPEYHLLLPHPIIFRMPRNKAPYAAAAISPFSTPDFLWRVLNLYRIAGYRALLSAVISLGLVIVAILRRSIALSWLCAESKIRYLASFLPPPPLFLSSLYGFPP